LCPRGQGITARVYALTARAPGVSESSTIDAIVGGLSVENCQDMLDRIKPKSLQELFEVMQEYCKSDKGRRRLDRANTAKKQKQQGQWDTPKGCQNHPPKSSHTVKSTMYLHPPIKTRAETAVGTKEGTRMVGDRSHRNRLHHLKGAAKGFSVGSMGSMLTTTRITALLRSRRRWTGKLRKRRRQPGWP
jgi:hypothetical protein